MEASADKLKEKAEEEQKTETDGKKAKGKKGKKKKAKKMEVSETGEIIEEEELIMIHDLRKSFTALPDPEKLKMPTVEKKKGEEGPQDSMGFLNTEYPCLATIGNEVHDNYFDFVQKCCSRASVKNDNLLMANIT